MLSVCPDSFAGPSESIVRTSISTPLALSSATEAASLAATGGSLSSVTVMPTVAVSHCGSGAPFVVPLSQALYEKVSGPL